MTNRTFVSLGLSALVLGGATVGCAGGGGSIASAGTRAATAPDDAARRAAKAIARGDAAAVALAEAAVAGAPTRADFRVLLGQSYIKAGRFQSARDAFADALTLQPDNGRAALNLALAQIATGDWGAARATLDVHAGRIAASDRGLAIALAGDPAGAVQLLMAAAREPGADAKLRQNLGLALALAGQWPLARTVAATDMSPADVDRRMAEWAAFAQPAAASDQVAALLGVTATADTGRPAVLALNAPVPVAPAPAAAEMVMALPVVPASEPVPALAAPAPTPAAQPVSAVRFGPRQEVAQPLPVPLLRADGPLKIAASPVRATIFKAAAPAARQTASGEWVVQLGAFQNAAVARDAWSRLRRRHAGFIGQQPRGMDFRSGGGDVYRLSVGGYDRAGADGVCRSVRAKGGACFVRRAAGDRLAHWARPGVRLTSL